METILEISKGQENTIANAVDNSLTNPKTFLFLLGEIADCLDYNADLAVGGKKRILGKVSS